jgi:hypothetical protein
MTIAPELVAAMIALSLLLSFNRFRQTRTTKKRRSSDTNKTIEPVTIFSTDGC